MTWSEFINVELIRLGEFRLLLGKLLLGLLVFVCTWIVIQLLKRTITRPRLITDKINAKRRMSIYLIVKYFVWVISILIFLEVIGVKFTVLLVGSELLGSLDRIDYIKCDVEGYEWIVFSEIKPVIAAKRPIVQIEIAPENEEKLLAYFTELNYQQFGIADFKIVPESGKQQEQGDFLFVPEEKFELVDGL